MKRSPGSGHIDTAIWMYMDANKTAGEETRWQLHKNACNPSPGSNTPQDTNCTDLPPITKSIQVRRTRHAGHCWRSRDELIRDVLLWIPTHGRAKAGRPARTYIQQLCEDTGCCPEDLPRAMNDREEWRERVRDIRAQRYDDDDDDNLEHPRPRLKRSSARVRSDYGVRQRSGQAVLPFLSDSILKLFYF